MTVVENVIRMVTARKLDTSLPLVHRWLDQCVSIRTAESCSHGIAILGTLPSEKV